MVNRPPILTDSVAFGAVPLGSLPPLPAPSAPPFPLPNSRCSGPTSATFEAAAFHLSSTPPWWWWWMDASLGGISWGGGVPPRFFHTPWKIWGGQLVGWGGWLASWLAGRAASGQPVGWQAMQLAVWWAGWMASRSGNYKRGFVLTGVGHRVWGKLLTRSLIIIGSL